jgi:hypothetical protein
MQQLESFGKRMQERYVKKNKFVHEKFLPSEIYLRTTHSPRTLDSLKSFILGFYGSENLTEGDVKVKIMPKEAENMYPRR